MGWKTNEMNTRLGGNRFYMEQVEYIEEGAGIWRRRPSFAHGGEMRIVERSEYVEERSRLAGG